MHRIAQACRDRLLDTLRRENSLLPELGPQIRDLLLAELPKRGPCTIQPWQVDLLLHTASRYRAGTAELLHQVSVNSKRRSFMSSASLTFSWAPFRGKTVCAWQYSFSEGIRLADATSQNITLEIETDTSDEFAEDVLEDSIRPTISTVVNLVRACLDAYRHGTQVPAFLTDPCSAASVYRFYLEALGFPQLKAVLIDVIHPYRRVFLCTPHFVAELDGTLANRARALPPASLCSAVLNSLGARSAAKLVEQEGARVWDLAAPKIAARALQDTATST
jgi:hypothetical protein